MGHRCCSSKQQLSRLTPLLCAATAPKGGGCRFGGDGTPGVNVVYMQSCFFTDSAADYGGALYADVGAVGSLDTCVLSSNTAKAAGGALLADDASAVSLTGCLLQGNGDYSDLGAPQVRGVRSGVPISFADW